MSNHIPWGHNNIFSNLFSIAWNQHTFMCCHKYRSVMLHVVLTYHSLFSNIRLNLHNTILKFPFPKYGHAISVFNYLKIYKTLSRSKAIIY